MDSINNILAVLFMGAAVITLMTGIVVLFKSWRHDRLVKQRLHAIHVSFLLESLKNKRD